MGIRQKNRHTDIGTETDNGTETEIETGKDEEGNIDIEIIKDKDRHWYYGDKKVQFIKVYNKSNNKLNSDTEERQKKWKDQVWRKVKRYAHKS